MNAGLEDVVVAETRLTEIDGEAGRLAMVGRPVAEVADAGLEAAAAWLWEAAGVAMVQSEGSADHHDAADHSAAADDDDAHAASIRRSLGEARVRAWATLPALPRSLDGMDALMLALATAPCDREDPIAITATLGVAAAAWAGPRNLAPDPSLPHAADLLRLLRGAAPSPLEARALDSYLGTVVDHGLNASTFAARVVASTGSDLRSAVLGALGALKGPLHGGAPGPVLDMLDAVGRPEQAAAWVEAEIAAGRRIMGMGHRVYRVRDPRAAVLERTAATLPDSRVPLARAVEAAAELALTAHKPGRRIRANIEFQTAVLLDALAIDRRAFTTLFAASRVVGWVAHVGEQRRTGRLIRPRARYVGPRA